MGVALLMYTVSLPKLADALRIACWMVWVWCPQEEAAAAAEAADHQEAASQSEWSEEEEEEENAASEPLLADRESTGYTTDDAALENVSMLNEAGLTDAEGERGIEGVIVENRVNSFVS